MHEIAEPVDLRLANGRLNPLAVSWTRRPPHRANLGGWGRCKRWEYWGILAPRHFIGLVASSIDYVGVHGIYVLGRRSGAETSRSAVIPGARGTTFPELSGLGRADAPGLGVSIRIDQQQLGTTIHARARDAEINVEISLPPEHESLGVVVPWSPPDFSTP